VKQSVGVSTTFYFEQNTLESVADPGFDFTGGGDVRLYQQCGAGSMDEA